RAGPEPSGRPQLRPSAPPCGGRESLSRSCRVPSPGRKRMSKKIYVGNLPFTATADDLREAFGHFGAVTSAQVVSDRDTGRSRGFGFVEMSDGADEAIASLNGAQFHGRTLTVNEA